jgi:hypothetical protein
VEMETAITRQNTGQIPGHELVGHRLVGKMPSQPLVSVQWVAPSLAEKLGPLQNTEHKHMEVRFAF